MSTNCLIRRFYHIPITKEEIFIILPRWQLSIKPLILLAVELGQAEIMLLEDIMLIHLILFIRLLMLELHRPMLKWLLTRETQLLIYIIITIIIVTTTLIIQVLDQPHIREEMGHIIIINLRLVLQDMDLIRFQIII